MNTVQAYQTYQQTANAQVDYMNTLLWLFFILVVIAPLVVLLSYIILAIIRAKHWPKCPKCNSRKTKSAVKITKKGDTTTSEKIMLCRSCEAEF